MPRPIVRPICRRIVCSPVRSLVCFVAGIALLLAAGAARAESCPASTLHYLSQAPAPYDPALMQSSRWRLTPDAPGATSIGCVIRVEALGDAGWTDMGRVVHRGGEWAFLAEGGHDAHGRSGVLLADGHPGPVTILPHVPAPTQIMLTREAGGRTFGVRWALSVEPISREEALSRDWLHPELEVDGELELRRLRALDTNRRVIQLWRIDPQGRSWWLYEADGDRTIHRIPAPQM